MTNVAYQTGVSQAAWQPGYSKNAPPVKLGICNNEKLGWFDHQTNVVRGSQHPQVETSAARYARQLIWAIATRLPEWPSHVPTDPTEAEISSHSDHESIYIAEDVKTGRAFTTKNLRWICPAKDLLPKCQDMKWQGQTHRDLRHGEALPSDLQD